jgi:RimJ/RimL family protein N-acetyltransferase
MLLDIPARIETERLYLRCYQPGDGPWYYAMSQKNRFADKDHEGQGLVTEAARAAIFEHLQAHRIRLEYDDTNVRNMRVAERCELVQEAHLRENKKNPDGTFSGTLYFGLLRSEA